MGFNTTVVVLNDALSYIAEDKDFGKNLSDAILRAWERAPVNVPAGNHGNAAMVVEQHHASSQTLVVVSGNRGQVLSPYASEGVRMKDDEAERTLRQMADLYGFRLIKKSTK